jgi:hypothetical protein
MVCGIVKNKEIGSVILAGVAYIKNCTPVEYNNGFMLHVILTNILPLLMSYLVSSGNVSGALGALMIVSNSLLCDNCTCSF